MPPRKANPDQMRALFDEGHSIRAIASKLNVHYSLVYRAIAVDAQILHEEARKRGISPAMLKNRLLRTILKDDLINAILDDKDDETSR
jgi:IS30 family transposase